MSGSMVVRLIIDMMISVYLMIDIKVVGIYEQRWHFEPQFDYLKSQSIGRGITHLNQSLEIAASTPVINKLGCRTSFFNLPSGVSNMPLENIQMSARH